MRKWNFFSKEKEKEIRYILSIDGGGMRGLIPAHILKKVAEELKEKGDKRPLYSHFDLIAGTSTGALIALGLTTPREYLGGVNLDEDEPYHLSYSYRSGIFRKRIITLDQGIIERGADPEKLEDIYRCKGPEIFKPKSSFRSLFGPVFGEKYSTACYEEYLTKTFGEARMSELHAPTIAISFNTQKSEPYIFRSYSSDGFLIREAARASSAAPLYFAPAKFINRNTGEEMCLIDGGMGANNPALLAYAEARKLYPNADEFRILSLSTCSPKFSYDASEQNGGVTGWASPIFRLYSEAELRVTDIALESIPDVSYTRIWSGKLKHKIKLDDTTDEAIYELTACAEDAYESNKEQISSFIDEIISAKTPDSIHLSGRKLLDERCNSSGEGSTSLSEVE